MTKLEEIDILTRLADLHKQATTENSHYYTAQCITEAIDEIVHLRFKIHRLRDAIEKKKERDGEWTYGDRELYKALEEE